MLKMVGMSLSTYLSILNPVNLEIGETLNGRINKSLFRIIGVTNSFDWLNKTVL